MSSVSYFPRITHDEPQNYHTGRRSGPDGPVFFYRWWRSLGHEVRILDRGNWPRAQTLLTDVNAVVVSVPIHISVDVINELADLLPEDAILADFTSVKVEPLQAMLAIHNGPVVGLHPMFGPTVDQPVGQTMVVTPGR